MATPFPALLTPLSAALPDGRTHGARRAPPGVPFHHRLHLRLSPRAPQGTIVETPGARGEGPGRRDPGGGARHQSVHLRALR